MLEAVLRDALSSILVGKLTLIHHEAWYMLEASLVDIFYHWGSLPLFLVYEHLYHEWVLDFIKCFLHLLFNILCLLNFILF
jgi:hypothetical protein